MTASVDPELKVLMAAAVEIENCGKRLTDRIIRMQLTGDRSDIDDVIASIAMISMECVLRHVVKVDLSAEGD
jgi:hypothetical protein